MGERDTYWGCFDKSGSLDEVLGTAQRGAEEGSVGMESF